MHVQRTYNEGEVLTSLCLWEAWLMFEETELTDDASEELREEYRQLQQRMEDIRGNHGSYVLRQAMIDLTRTIEQAWDALVSLKDEHVCFDFEFVPDQLKAMIKDGRFEEALAGQYGGVAPGWLVLEAA